MAGLFDRLFGGKDNQPVGDFYLDQDSAKTLGDVQYMRKRTTIKRTFPKVGDAEEGAEIVAEVSSSEKVEILEEEPKTQAMPKSTFEPRKTAITETNESMDFFRKLAKDVKRR